VADTYLYVYFVHELPTTNALLHTYNSRCYNSKDNQALVLYNVLLQLLESLDSFVKGIYVFAECKTSIDLSNVGVLLAVKLQQLMREWIEINVRRIYLADGNRRDTNFYSNEPACSVHIF